MKFAMNRKWEIGLSILLFALVGCGRSDLPQIGQVKGVITLDGKPLPDALVKFQPASGRFSSGVSNEKGQFELLYVRGKSGAAVGKHTVSIVVQPLVDADQRSGPQVTVPAKYNTETTLSADVKAGEQTIDFEL